MHSAGSTARGALASASNIAVLAAEIMLQILRGCKGTREGTLRGHRAFLTCLVIRHFDHTNMHSVSGEARGLEREWQSCLGYKSLSSHRVSTSKTGRR